MAGDPTLVEDEQELGTDRRLVDEGCQLLELHLGQMTVGVVVQRDRGDAEDARGSLELSGP